MNLREVHDVVHALITDEPYDTDCYRSGVLLVAAFVVTPSQPKLRDFTRLPGDVIRNCGWYFRRNGIWTGNRRDNYTMRVDWFDPDDLDDPSLQTVAFMMDCLVGTGHLTRKEDENGKLLYRNRMFGDYTDHADDPEWQIPWVEIAKPDVRERRRFEKYRHCPMAIRNAHVTVRHHLLAARGDELVDVPVATVPERTFQTRVVSKPCTAGDFIVCRRCGAEIKYRARTKDREVLCNVYENGAWDRLERFHPACYVGAGEPYGPVVEASGLTGQGLRTYANR